MASRRMGCTEIHKLGAVFAVLTALSFSAWGAGESKLSQEPIPLQTEAHALFAVDDITSFEGLIAEIRADADDPATPGGRVWELLPPALKQDLEAVPEGQEYEDNLTYRIINALNGMIRRRDLYTEAAFSSVQITPEMMTQLRGGLDGLTPIEATKVNRDLLKASFPEYILESQVDPFPRRPKTLRIFGDDFLNTGNLQRGFTLPTGAVWQPSLLAFGTFRSAWQYQDTGDRDPDIPVPGSPDQPIRGQEIDSEEWVNRLDLFFNLYFTQTERIVLGLRPLDEDGTFSGYVWQPDRNTEVDEWEGGLDADIEQLFFEGDLGELFPNLDREDRRDLDIGMAVGRQPIFLQEGILFNDMVDGLGFTVNNLIFPGISNLRITGFWAWQGLNRGQGPNNQREDSDELYGIFTSIDTPRSTIDFDIAYIDGDSRIEYLGGPTPMSIPTARRRGDDQLNIGLSFVQRFGQINTAFRFNTSELMGGTSSADAGDGQLFFAEASFTPHHTHDLVYGTFFWANDDYRSIARDPAVGGPLGRTGILFEAFGIGTQTSPISNLAFESVGGAIGYQKFFDDTRKQVILEVGGRTDTDGRDESAYGVGIRYQQAFYNRFVWRSDAYWVDRNGIDDRTGIRTELVMQF